MSGILHFLIQGSQPDPYVVTFQRHNRQVIAKCTCLAGENGQVCKHRLSLMEGDFRQVLSFDEVDRDRLIVMLADSELEEQYQAYLAAIDENEAATKRMKDRKKSLAMLMLGQSKKQNR